MIRFVILISHNSWVLSDEIAEIADDETKGSKKKHVKLVVGVEDFNTAHQLVRAYPDLNFTTLQDFVEFKPVFDIKYSDRAEACESV